MDWRRTGRGEIVSWSVSWTPTGIEPMEQKKKKKIFEGKKGPGRQGTRNQLHCQPEEMHWSYSQREHHHSSKRKKTIKRCRVMITNIQTGHGTSWRSMQGKYSMQHTCHLLYIHPNLCLWYSALTVGTSCMIYPCYLRSVTLGKTKHAGKLQALHTRQVPVVPYIHQLILLYTWLSYVENKHQYIHIYTWCAGTWTAIQLPLPLQW